MPYSVVRDRTTEVSFTRSTLSTLEPSYFSFDEFLEKFMARYGQYGDIALEVVRNFLFSANVTSNPAEEWDEIARKKQMALSARDKDSPKRAFLGLCDAGLVKGIRPGPYTASVKNKKYVLEAVHLLKHNRAFANIATTGKLWASVLDSLADLPGTNLAKYW